MTVSDNPFRAFLALIVKFGGIPADARLALYLATALDDPLILVADYGDEVPPNLPLIVTDQEIDQARQRWAQSLRVLAETNAEAGSVPHKYRRWTTADIPFSLRSELRGRLLIALPEPHNARDFVDDLQAVLTPALPLLVSSTHLTALQDLLEGLPLAICLVDRTAQILQHTTAFRQLISHPEPNGQSLAEVAPSYPPWGTLLDLAANTQMSIQRDLIVATNLLFRVRAWIRPLFGQQGNPRQFIVSLLPRKLPPWTPARAWTRPVPEIEPTTTVAPSLSALLLSLDTTGHPELVDRESITMLISHAIDRILHKLHPLAVKRLTDQTIALFFPSSEWSDLILQTPDLQKDLNNRLGRILTWPFFVSLTLELLPDAAELWQLLSQPTGHLCVTRNPVIPQTLVPPRTRNLTPWHHASPRELLEALFLKPPTFLMQPIVSLREGKTVAWELLARFQLGERLLSFNDLLPLYPLVERVAAIDAAGLTVAQQVARQIQLPVHVNISLSSLTSPTFETAIEQAGDLSQIVIEVVESWSLAVELLLAQQTLAELIDRGARIALDHLGSCGQSLDILFCLPVHVMKLDGSLIARLRHDQHARRLVSAFTRLAHELGIPLIAEQVEDELTVTLLRSLDVDYGQGYLFGRPQPLDPNLTVPDETKSA